ncbi:hypothetical protein F5887DRAFT_230113 [Amanita rubescens]|nr:hypothetical protein F5887DRAFT_1084122 [Amanita rubescens]KAF8345129.1 hypothetical protein F5887DRAFT_230113 [Amanita rubescens]
MRLTLSIPRILSIAVLASFAGAVRVPNADTPSFYFVASSAATGPNLLPLRTSGGAGGYATLTGSGPIGVFYFYQGVLTAAAAPGSTSTTRALIGAIPLSTGCTTYGPLGFAGSSSDKCAKYSSFQIQSDTENSQLGAQLTFNYVGGFYACGSGKDVWYQASPTSGPPGLTCTPIALWTVPLYGP